MPSYSPTRPPWANTRFETVKIADTTIRESEGIYPYYKDLVSHDRTQAIASAAVRLVRTLDSKPIVITSTGRAAIEISRFRPNSDVLVYSHDEAVLRSLCLGWGLSPIGTIPPKRDLATLVDLLIKTSLDKGLVRETDVVTIVYGFFARGDWHYQYDPGHRHTGLPVSFLKLVGKVSSLESALTL